MNEAVLMVIFFLVMVFIGLPIAFSFAGCSLAYLMLSMDGNGSILISRSFGGVDSFSLMAVPFFVFAGDIMKEGGLSRSLIEVADKLVGRIKGGMGHVCIVACAFFGAISGSSGATVAAIGGIMIPEMEKRGYDKRYAAALASASGFLGIMIPPSIPLIIYGLNAQVSVADLFVASIVPGLVMIGTFMALNYKMVDNWAPGSLIATSLQIDADAPKEAKKSVMPAIIMPVIILGGIYSGVFTPTEAGAVAVVYAILTSAFYYKTLKFKQFLDITTGSSVTSAVILVIIAFASVFGWIMTTEQLPIMLRDTVISITTNKYLVLLIINIIYLILGTFMETITAIVITTPMFLPLVTALGVDPIHFGILQQTNLCVGLITPPMALNLLIATKISNQKLDVLVKPLMPFLIGAIIVTLIVTYVPALSLFLLNVLK